MWKSKKWEKKAKQTDGKKMGTSEHGNILMEGSDDKQWKVQITREHVSPNKG